MTSFGDVFYQPFGVVPLCEITDKTYSSGLGCDRVQLSVDHIDATRQWVAEANRQLNIEKTADVGDRMKLNDVRQLFTGKL